MSQSSAGGGREGLTKYMKGIGSLLRRGSKKTPVAGSDEPSGQKSAKPTSKTTPTAATSPSKNEPASTTTKKPPVVYGWSDVQQERARALFAKYGLTLEPEEWMSPRNIQVERVEKPIRMRVRRFCHRCQITFGRSKVCSNCQHVRCQDCPRYPPKKSREGKGKEKATAAVPISKRRSAPLTMPSRRGGQDLVFHPARQRVRRTCHQCGTLFRGMATECVSCQHIRCKNCPREPPKRDKYPDGYPGDVDPPYEPPRRVWRKPRRRVRYICHNCNTMYLPGSNTCAQCGQEKGEETIRDPPKRVKPPPDPELVRRVEERLAALSLNREGAVEPT